MKGVFFSVILGVSGLASASESIDYSALGKIRQEGFKNSKVMCLKYNYALDNLKEQYF